MKRLILMAASALLMMTQCRKSEVSPVPPGADTIKITVTAGPSRTDITPGGAITWSKGDVLWVSDGTNWLGSLFIQQGAGQNTAVFTGDVHAGNLQDKGEAHIFYLGSHNGVKPSGTGDVTIDFSKQYGGCTGGRFVNVSRLHIGYGVARNITVSNNKIVSFSVTLTSKVAMAYMDISKGGSPYNGPVRLTGTNMSNEMKVTSAGGFSAADEADGTIDLAFTGLSERCVMLVPQETVSAVEMTFEVKEGATVNTNAGTMTLGGIEANKLYMVGDQPIRVELAGAAEEEGVRLWEGGPEFAKHNLGATVADAYGDYYAWGELEMKAYYSWSTYKWGTDEALTKYDAAGAQLQNEDDVAWVMSGGAWRTPTGDELDDMTNTGNTSVEYSGFTNNGIVTVSGKATDYANNTITLPVVGCYLGIGLTNVGFYGNYWSSSLTTDDASNGRELIFDSSIFKMSRDYRSIGHSVRPVRVQ